MNGIENVRMGITIALAVLLVLTAGTASAATFSEGFEDGNLNGWTVHNISGDSEWEAHEAGNYPYAHGPTWVAKIDTFNRPTNDDWLITPALQPDATDNFFSFWYKSFSHTNPESFNVKLSTTGTDIADFTVTLDEITDAHPGWNNWTKYTNVLPSEYYGATIYIAVQCVSEDKYSLYVDDFALGPQTCGYIYNTRTLMSFSTIQAAINDASTLDGDTITVSPGTCIENVDVTKELTIKSTSGDPADTIVQASVASDHVFEVRSSNVNIDGFTVTGATGINKAGICLSADDHTADVEHCTISNNSATGNRNGIYLGSWWFACRYNTVTGNTANSNTEDGIHLLGAAWGGDTCRYNTVTGNTANSNGENGIYLGSDWSYCADNEIVCNWVHDNGVAGIYLTASSTDNNISCNNIDNYDKVAGSWNFHNDQPDDVVAINNWWGTNDSVIIGDSIYDESYDSNLGTVTYTPYEGGPCPCAPVPELATVMLVSLGLAGLVGCTLVRRKD